MKIRLISTVGVISYYRTELGNVFNITFHYTQDSWTWRTDYNSMGAKPWQLAYYDWHVWVIACVVYSL